MKWGVSLFDASLVLVSMNMDLLTGLELTTWHSCRWVPFIWRPSGGPTVDGVHEVSTTADYRACTCKNLLPKMAVQWQRVDQPTGKNHSAIKWSIPKTWPAYHFIKDFLYLPPFNDIMVKFHKFVNHGTHNFNGSRLWRNKKVFFNWTLNNTWNIFQV